MTFRSALTLLSVLVLIVAVAITVWTGERTASRRPALDDHGRADAPAAPAVIARQGSREQILKTYADLPLTFVENRGQTDPRVHYYARGSRYAFYFTREAVVLSFVQGVNASNALWRTDAAEARGSSVGPRSSIIPAVATRAAAEQPAIAGINLALRFLRANPQVTLEGEERAPGKVNYLRGNDPARWHTQLPSYTSVVYRELWPGVDMVLRGQDGQLKYEFRVRPGARLADIRLAYAGADGLALDDAGALLIETPLGALQDAPPVAYQEIDGEPVPVDSRYVLNEDAGDEPEYGFAVGAYDPGQELIIDPGVDYSTYLGGSSDEDGNDIAVDAAGNAYIVGTTQSTDFPTTTGAFDRSFAGGVVDVFVTKLNADGSGLVYSTYLGGTPTPPLVRGTGDPFEFGRGIAVDANGNAYITGQTTSSDFPTTSGAFDTTLNIGDRDATDAFVTKLNPQGSGLVYSTFLGGTSFDDGRTIALDGSGNAYVAGETDSSNFPTTSGAFDTTQNSGRDAFVTKLNASGSQLVYSTFLGGADNETAGDITVDAAGNAYVAGGTRSADFPTTEGAFDPTHNGGAFDQLFDAFVTKLNASGSQLVYSTFLGGSNIDRAGSLAIDTDGNAYVSGGTLSSEFPTTEGAFDRTPGPRSDGLQGTSDTFVTKLNGIGSGLIYSTFMSQGAGADIALDADNNAWLVGGVSSDRAQNPDNVHTTPDGFQTQFGGGGSDAHIAQLNAAGSALVYGTFLGGSNSEGATGVALDPNGNVSVVGNTLSADFPTTQGAFDRTFAGDPSIFWGDAFVTKFGSGDGTGEPTPPAPRTTTNFSGRIDKNQMLRHTVSVGAAGPVDLALDWSETRANLTLRALDPAGNVVFSASGSARPKTGTFSAAGAGDYRFEITNTTDRRTNYTLSVTYPVASSSTEPAPAALASLSLSPTSVMGGESSTGTVTLDAAAPEGGASVTLSSSNTAAATVPPSITVPAGATTATFTVSTSSVSSNTSLTISATYEGVTRTATLTVNAPATTDTVSISRAEYDGGKRVLRVEASSSSSSATLTVYVTATDELIGTLSGGKGEFSWPTNPQSITVRSSLGGSATRTVTLK